MRRYLLALVLLALALAAAPARAAEEIPGWTAVSCGCGQALSVDLVDADRAFLGTDAGVARSDNGGWTWRALPFPVSGAVQRVSFSDRDHGAAVGEFDGVVVTEDGGTTWKQSSPWNGQGLDVVALPERWFGLAASGLYSSIDEGQSWQRVHKALEPTSPYTRMSWSDDRIGVIANGAAAWTTTDGGRTFTEATLSSFYVFAALSLGPNEAVVAGDLSARSGVPFVARVEASRHAPLALDPRGVAEEQVRGLARSGRAFYAVGVEGLLARSTDAGRTWTYEKPPESYEESAFYGVDAYDGDHAIVAVYGGRVLLRNASTAYDQETAPNRGLGTGLGVLALVGAGAGTWAVVTRRPKALVGGLAGATLLAGIPGVLLATETKTCHPSGCSAVPASSGGGDGRVAPPSPSPTPTPTPTPSPTLSPTPSPTPSPTRSRTPSPTPSATRSVLPLPAFTATLTKNPSCDVDGEGKGVAVAGTITLRNTTVTPKVWNAAAREKVADEPWAALTPASGTVGVNASTTVSVLPSNDLCTPGEPPTTQHVDISYGAGQTIEVAITITPQA